MKQYLILRAVEGLNHVVDLITLPGLYTLGAAQKFIHEARLSEPDTTFLIQEVGNA